MRKCLFFNFVVSRGILLTKLFFKCEEISDKVRKKWRKIWKRLYRPFRPIKWSSDILVLYFVFINVGYTNQDQNNTEKVRTKVNDTADISPAPRPRKLTFIRSWSLWMSYETVYLVILTSPINLKTFCVPAQSRSYTPAASPSNSALSIINELADREKRRKNVIVYNFPEVFRS